MSNPNEYTGKRKPLLPKLPTPRANLAPQDGQHLIVARDLHCDGCGVPCHSYAVKHGQQLLCVPCYDAERNPPEDAPAAED